MSTHNTDHGHMTDPTHPMTIATIADLARVVTGLRPDLEYHYERHEIRAAVAAERTVRYEDHDDTALAALAERVEKRLVAEDLRVSTPSMLGRVVWPAREPSNLESVVAAAARTGDPSDPDTLRQAAAEARARGLAVALGAPLTAEERERAKRADAAAADARIEAASRALHEAHLAVVDAANEWETDPDNAGSRTALCATVRRWRAAGERFTQAVRGGT